MLSSYGRMLYKIHNLFFKHWFFFGMNSFTMNYKYFLKTLFVCFYKKIVQLCLGFICC